MKKQILLVALLLSSKAFSQSFTASNEPQVGSNVSMYVLDTATVDLANIKGNGVTWDYSTISIADSTIKNKISVIDPKTTKYTSDFKNAKTAITIEKFLTTYFTSDANQRTSLGYYLPTKDYGDVKAIYNLNQEITQQYPTFKLNDKINDDFGGTLYYTIASIPINTPMAGKSTSEVDGFGNLKIGKSTEFKDITRYHIFDSINATVNVTTPFPLGEVNSTVIRNQYEYYDLKNSNLPIFVHTTFTIKAKNQQYNFTFPSKSVLSKYYGFEKGTASTIQLKSNTFIIAPNPTKESILISGLTERAIIRIIDQSGKEIKNITSTQGQESIDLNGIEDGIYFISIETNSFKEIQKIEKN